MLDSICSHIYSSRSMQVRGSILVLKSRLYDCDQTNIMHYLPPTYVVRGKVLFTQACDILFREGGQARQSMLWSRFGGIKSGGSGGSWSRGVRSGGHVVHGLWSWVRVDPPHTNGTGTGTVVGIASER